LAMNGAEETYPETRSVAVRKAAIEKSMRHAGFAAAAALAAAAAFWFLTRRD
jgi:hypothetical protein